MDINKIRTIKTSFFCVCVHKSGRVPLVVGREGIKRVSLSLLRSLVEYTSASFGEISQKSKERNPLKCSQIQMVQAANRNKSLLPLHHHLLLLPLPPYRPCCLWCEAGWRPIMSLCLFRQSCLKLWCVTRAELYSLRPTSGRGIKASRQCLHLPQEDKGSSEKHLNTALPQWSLDSFFLRVLFLFFQTSELTAKNAPALKLTYLSSPW